MKCSPTGSLYIWDFPGKTTSVGCHFLLQGVFLTQGLDLDLLHYTGRKYQLHFVRPLKDLSVKGLETLVAGWPIKLFAFPCVLPRPVRVIFSLFPQTTAAEWGQLLEWVGDCQRSTYPALCLTLMPLASPQGKSLVCWPQTVPTTCHGVSSVAFASLSAKSLQRCVLLLHTLASSTVATQSDPECIPSCFSSSHLVDTVLCFSYPTCSAV